MEGRRLVSEFKDAGNGFGGRQFVAVGPYPLISVKISTKPCFTGNVIESVVWLQVSVMF